MIRGTVCHVIKEGKTLMLRKSEGLFGGGKWNCPGGKIKNGETPEQCIIREILEETGLRIKNPANHGTLTFYFGDEGSPAWVVDVFSSREFDGEVMADCVEGTLSWFPIQNLPFDEMWEDDRYWIPLVFKGKRFVGSFYFDASMEKLLKYSISVIE